MEREDSLFESRAYARKDILQEDFAIRVSEALSSAGELYKSMAFAKSQNNPVGVAPLMQKLVMYDNKIQSTDDPMLREIWAQKAEKTYNEIRGHQEVVRRQVDPDAFIGFLINFYELWLEGKDQIGAKQWAKKDTKENIKNLFTTTSYGELDPRASLELFEEYIHSLQKCGILNFKYSTFRVGETFRESIG